MHITVNVSGLEKLRDGILNPKTIDAAARSALKKTAQQTRTQAIKIIREEYNLSASVVRDKIKIIPDRASGRLIVIISGRGRGIPLSVFAPRQVGVKVGKMGMRYTRNAKSAGTIVGAPGLFRSGRAGGQVTVLVKKGGGRKPLTDIPKPFITKLKSGHIGVFHRIDANTKRLPIKQLYGPGVGLLFGSVSNRLTEFADQKFPNLMKHELEWRLSK